MKKILTVIVPSYNMEKYLPKCLGSLVVAPELMERLEVLVVNDGSKDRTSEIAHEFAAKWPQTFKVIDKTNGNYGSCINAALPCCSGVFVKVLDADDYLEPAGLGNLISEALSVVNGGDEDIDLIVADYDKVDNTGRCLKIVHYNLPVGRTLTLQDKDFNEVRFEIQSVAYRIKLLRDVGYRQSEGVSYSDTEWVIEPMASVRKLRFVSGVVSHYLVGREGQTIGQATFLSRFQQLVNIMCGLVERYPDRVRSAATGSLGYYRHCVVAAIRLVYATALLGINGKRPNVKLDEFESAVSRVPELQDATSAFVIASKLFGFHYVAEWRRVHHLKSWRYLLFDLYAAVRRSFCRGKV